MRRRRQMTADIVYTYLLQTIKTFQPCKTELNGINYWNAGTIGTHTRTTLDRFTGNRIETYLPIMDIGIDDSIRDDCLDFHQAGFRIILPTCKNFGLAIVAAIYEARAYKQTIKLTLPSKQRIGRLEANFMTCKLSSVPFATSQTLERLPTMIFTNFGRVTHYGFRELRQSYTKWFLRTLVGSL